MNANPHAIDEFSEAIDRYGGALRRYLFHLTKGNGSAADDMAQEALIKAYTHWHTCHSARQAWLFRIAYRTFLDAKRAGAAHPTGDITTLAPNYEAATSHLEILERTTECLDENEKNLVILSFVEELSHSDIAEVTGQPLGSVKTTLRRAKEKLKNHLSNERL